MFLFEDANVNLVRSTFSLYLLRSFLLISRPDDISEIIEKIAVIKRCSSSYRVFNNLDERSISNSSRLFVTLRIHSRETHRCYIATITRGELTLDTLVRRSRKLSVVRCQFIHVCTRVKFYVFLRIFR